MMPGPFAAEIKESSMRRLCLTDAAGAGDNSVDGSGNRMAIRKTGSMVVEP
jgi:hypothetical protein